ncbi:MAG: TRIC cation channel family protein [Schwartzia sp.]|nr:TRIC cation channel family protein [Schwartzia sp. (in: firmicutes)]
MMAFDIIGTLAFAILGAWEGVRKGLDILGAAILGLMTAVGGGLVRDAVLSNTPPMIFRNPLYILVSLAGVALVLLARPALRRVIRAMRHGSRAQAAALHRRIRTLGLFVQVCDAIGLGAFAAAGADLAAATGHNNLQTVLFVGTVTAVGGGILRDICIQKTPSVFYKEIYLTAALLGALAYYLALPRLGETAALYLAFAVTTGLRLLAIHYHWRLPRA